MAESLSYKPEMGDPEAHRQLAQKRVDDARAALVRAKEKGVSDLTSFQNRIEEAETNLGSLTDEIAGEEEQEKAA